MASWLLADEVVNGFKEVGFIYLDGHGIPSSTVKTAFQQVGHPSRFDFSSSHRVPERRILPPAHRTEGNPFPIPYQHCYRTSNMSSRINLHGKTLVRIADMSNSAASE